MPTHLPQFPKFWITNVNHLFTLPLDYKCVPGKFGTSYQESQQSSSVDVAQDAARGVAWVSGVGGGSQTATG